MSREENLSQIIKILGRIFKNTFQYPKAQKGAYAVATNKLEKVKWAYRHWHHQLEVAEKDSGLEEYFAHQRLDFHQPIGFHVTASLSLCAAGDLLAVDVLVPDNTPHLFEEIKDFYSGADLVCANLESPVAINKPIGRTQSFGQPAQMNTSREMLEIFHHQGGMNYLSTANNHAMDWGEEGLLSTMDELDRLGILHSGTNRSFKEQEAPKLVEIRGIKLALLAYTMDLNGRNLPEDKAYLVNRVPFNDEICPLDLIESQVARAKEEGADFIIASCHWGWEFEMYPHKNVVEVAHKLIETGIDLILGNHPHVAQPMEKYIYEKEGQRKSGLIFYALGNFVGYHPRSKNSSLAYTIRMNLVKGRLKDQEKTLIDALEILPLYLMSEDLGGGRYNCQILPFYQVLKDAKEGRAAYNLTHSEKEHLPHLEEVLRKLIIPQNYGHLLVKKLP